MRSVNVDSNAESNSGNQCQEIAFGIFATHSTKVYDVVMRTAGQTHASLMICENLCGSQNTKSTSAWHHRSIHQSNTLALSDYTAVSRKARMLRHGVTGRLLMLVWLGLANVSAFSTTTQSLRKSTPIPHTTPRVPRWQPTRRPQAHLLTTKGTDDDEVCKY